MKLTTLCFLVKDDEICLAMKKRGFGVGKYNGVGGKVKEGETIKQAALREMKEEIGVISQEKDLEEKGSLKFFFKNASEDWNQHMHIFFVKNWSGEPAESDEMKPRWYKHHEIPFDKMWVDDPYWLPKAIEGKKIQGEFCFNEDGSEFEKFDIREI